MKYSIGIDGGGTKTAIEALGSDGSVRNVVSGAMNYNFSGIDAAVRSITDGLTVLGINKKDIEAAAIGDPSVDDEAVSESAVEFRSRVSELFGVPLRIRSDAYMALYALAGEESGVLVTAGTGAMGIASDVSGKIHVAGGWGRLTGDEGGGYYIALCAIQAALRYSDGTGAKTVLLDELLSFYKKGEARQLIDVFYADPSNPPEIAAFSRTVARCAEAGDVIAHDILLDAGIKLAGFALALCRRADYTEKIIGVSGSVLLNDITVRGCFERTVLAERPGTLFKVPDISPQHAAALYALKHKGDTE